MEDHDTAFYSQEPAQSGILTVLCLHPKGIRDLVFPSPIKTRGCFRPRPPPPKKKVSIYTKYLHLGSVVPKSLMSLMSTSPALRVTF